MSKLLSICIPSVIGRELSCSKLIENINRQIKEGQYEEFVELIVDKDNKEVSIGFKRQRMYLKCKGLFAVQIDDDDNIAEDYIKTFFDNFDPKVDCYGYQELCNFDRSTQKKSDFSIKYKKWYELKLPVNGFNHFRTPFCKSPIKTKLCQEVGVEDMRFGEDHSFAIRIYPFLKKEIYIDKIMYLYQFTSENHNSKYGIK